MNSPVSLAIVGCGGMGRRHVHGLAELRAAERESGRSQALLLTAVIDRDPARAARLATEAESLLGLRPHVIDDLAVLASRGVATAVDVCTGTETHHSLGLAALDLGFDLLLEKPLAATIRGGRALITAAARTGRTLAVAENVRREPVNRLAHALIAAGILGEVRFVVDLVAGGGDSILLTPWRHDRRTGGILLDVGVHHADVIEYLAGPIDHVVGRLRLDEPLRHRRAQSPVASAEFYSAWHDDLPETAPANIDDVASALLAFANGAGGVWTIHQAAHGHPRASRTIFGATGSLDLPRDRSGHPAVLTLSDGRRFSGAEILPFLPDLTLPGIEAVIWGDPRLAHASLDFASIDRKLVAVELADFAAAIAGRHPPEVDGALGLRSMAILFAVAESHLHGGPVQIADVLTGDVHAYQDPIDTSLGLITVDHSNAILRAVVPHQAAPE